MRLQLRKGNALGAAAAAVVATTDKVQSATSADAVPLLRRLSGGRSKPCLEQLQQRSLRYLWHAAYALDEALRHDVGPWAEDLIGAEVEHGAGEGLGEASAAFAGRDGLQDNALLCS